MDIEIRTAEGELVETLKWEGEPWDWRSAEAEERRWALKKRAEARAWELGALAYEVHISPVGRNLESIHRDFPCREVSEEEAEVTTPVGTFRLRARRARPGETATSVAFGPGMIGSGRTATEEQASPPVRISGRLNAPTIHLAEWTFQPAHFDYEDGTHSDYLGSPSIKIKLEPRGGRGDEDPGDPAYAITVEVEGESHDVTGDSLEEIHVNLHALGYTGSAVRVLGAADRVVGWASATDWHSPC